MKKKKIIIGIIIIFLIVILIKANFSKKDNLNETSNNINEISEERDITKKVAIVGMKNIWIKSNSRKAKVSLVNPIENKGYYYQEFELRLLNNNEEYEVLYKSNLLEPGEEISEITLSREIEKGEYETILYVQPYRMDKEKTKTSDAQIKVKLIVE